MSRRTLTDAQWGRIEEHLPGRDGLPGRSGTDNRLFVDAVLWLARTAAPWRDLPPEFGRWTGAHARFRRWATAGIWVGRSRGGPTTKIHAAVDALGLPVRLIPTAGQRGDSPQAVALIDGLDGVGDVIADAAYDSGTWRGKIRDELGARARSQANPSRAIKPPLDPDLYAERHKVENFFQRIRRFRRVALRCEKTIPSLMGFVFLVSARDWLR